MGLSGLRPDSDDGVRWCCGEAMGRYLIIIGLLLAATGLLWPLLSKLPLFRLPGDIVVRRPGFTFCFPLTTSLVVSIVLTLLLWLFRK